MIPISKRKYISVTTHGLVKLLLLNTLLFARVTVISHAASNKDGWVEGDSQGLKETAFCVIHNCSAALDAPKRGETRASCDTGAANR